MVNPLAARFPKSFVQKTVAVTCAEVVISERVTGVSATNVTAILLLPLTDGEISDIGEDVQHGHRDHCGVRGTLDGLDGILDLIGEVEAVVVSACFVSSMISLLEM